jgi:hypothetical protein
MQIAFERSGGFAGVTLGVSVDTATLPPGEAQEIEGLVRQANFFEIPSQSQTAGRGADRFQYDLTISDGSQRHHVTVGETAVPDTLRPLVQHLTELARRR